MRDAGAAASGAPTSAQGARRRGRAIVRAALALAALAGGCRATPDRRESTLAVEGRDDQRVAGDAVVRDLRSPADSERIIYTRPTPLAQPPAATAGAAAVTAPFGIAPPDSAQGARTPTGAGTTGAKRAPGSQKSAASAAAPAKPTSH